MAGQPKAIIDWKKVDDLLIAGCSGREIAGQLGIYHGTLYDRCFTDNGIQFSEYSQQKYSKGDALLRATQFAKALGKNKDADNTMLIWLGKQRLKQREPKNIENEDLNNIVAAVYEITERNRSGIPIQSRMENKESLCDQRPHGQENSFHSQLGTGTDTIRSSSIEDNIESPSARDDDSDMYRPVGSNTLE